MNSIKPIHDTVYKESSSALKACSLEREAVLGMLADVNKKLDIKTAEVSAVRKLARKRFWIIAAMGGSMALGLFVAIRRKIVKKVIPV